MKRLILFLFGLLVSFASQAQATTQSSIWDDPMTKFYLVVSFIFVVSLLVLLVLIYLLKVVNILAEKAAREKAERAGKIYQPAPSVFKSFWDTINGFVPKEKEEQEKDDKRNHRPHLDVVDVLQYFFIHDFLVLELVLFYLCCFFSFDIHSESLQVGDERHDFCFGQYFITFHF